MATDLAAYGLDGFGPAGWGLVYFGLLVWLFAGMLDFGFHRRTDLPHTSGIGESTFSLNLRRPALPVPVWLLVLVPAALLCVLPALLEWSAAWRARHERHGKKAPPDSVRGRCSQLAATNSRE